MKHCFSISSIARSLLPLILCLSVVTARIGEPADSYNHKNNTSPPTSMRFLRETKSSETVLAIRLRALTEDGKDFRSTILSHDQVVDRLFAEENSIKAQFEACSGGQFTIEPLVTLRTPQGVRMFTVYQPINELTTTDFINIANARLCTLWDLGVGCNLAKEMNIDHIAYIIPYGVKDAPPTGRLYATVWGVQSVYVDSSQYQVESFTTEAVLHEFGHNFGIGHSRESGEEYGDRTGPMGPTFYLWGDYNGNQRCYNGWNMYELGWFKENTVIVPEGESRTLQIRGVADNGESPMNLIVKYGDFYVTYNRAKGINYATKEKLDRIIVVQHVADQRNSLKYETELVGDLGPGESLTFGDLKVEVCYHSSWPVTEATIAVGANASCLHQEEYCVPNGAIARRKRHCCSQRWYPDSQVCHR